MIRSNNYFLKAMIIILLFFCNSKNIVAQNDFKKNYLAYSKTLADSILEAAKNDYDLKIEIDTTSSIIGVPYYNFEYDGKILLNDFNGIKFLKVNNFTGYGLIKKKDEIIGYGNQYRNQYRQEKAFYQASLLYDPMYRTELKLIPAAKKLSQTFFLFISYQEKASILRILLT